MAALLGLCLMSRPGFAGWFAGAAPADPGVSEGRLKPCPVRPNCVSSQASGASHVPALVFQGDSATVLQRLKTVLESMPRMRIVAQTPTYIRAEAASRIFGFVDDVEFLLDAQARLVHVRSASRLGYSDLGVNRRRIEAVRAAFNASQSGT